MTIHVDYLLIGAVTADITPQGKKLGGTASYCARVAHAFGQNVAVITRAQYQEPLLGELTPYARVFNLGADVTTTFENVYTPSGRVQTVRATAGYIGRRDVEQWDVRAPLLHLAPVADEVAPEIVFDFPSAQILLTPQGWMRQWGADGKVAYKRWADAHILRRATAVVLSREDIATDDTIEAELARHTSCLVVTDSERGGVYYQNGRQYGFDALSVEVRDATGAGDVFAASLLSALGRLEGDIHRAVRVAARLASLSVTRTGMDSAPKPDEIEEAFRQLR